MPAHRPAMDMQTSGRLLAAALLKQSLGFRDCEPEARQALAEAGHVLSLAKGEALVRRGDRFEHLLVIVDGAIESSVLHQDGRRHLLAFLGPGDIAATVSLWDGLPHLSDLIARETATRVLLVRGPAFRALRDRFASLARALELQMAYRSRLIYERLLVDTTMTLDVRLARQLHLQAITSGRPQPDGVALTLQMSQADIGDWLGVSRQRANFAVQQLKRDGLIALHYASLTIIDPPGLAERAGLGLMPKPAGS